MGEIYRTAIHFPFLLDLCFLFTPIFLLIPILYATNFLIENVFITCQIVVNKIDGVIENGTEGFWKLVKVGRTAADTTQTEPEVSEETPTHGC